MAQRKPRLNHLEGHKQQLLATNCQQPDVVWTIRPTHTPSVWRKCPHCNEKRAFTCSEKFRTNAYGKQLDVWLIYKCATCGATWNCTIFSGIAVQALDPALYARFQENDQQTAWLYAFDHGLLKRNGAEVDRFVAYQIEGDERDWREYTQPQVVLQVTCAYQLQLRLDTLLANQLGLTRKDLEVVCTNLSGSSLRHKFQTEVLVWVDMMELRRLSSKYGAISGAQVTIPHIVEEEV